MKQNNCRSLMSKNNKKDYLSNKAFTLIELLAVIVVLAIIALIATPLIMNIINEAKKGAFKNSTYGIIKAAEHGFAQSMIKENNIEETEYEYEDGNNILHKGNVAINYKGSNPKSGVVLVNKEGQVAVALSKDGYCITKTYDEDDIEVTKKEHCVLKMKEFDEIKGVNKPVVSSGMIPIKWDENNNEIETTIDDLDWYDYENQKWANVKTKDGSYFVWIPRYAYKITDGYHSKDTGTIDVKFLRGTSNHSSDATKIEKTGYNVQNENTSNHYFLHPAFNFDGDALGYWVAKYEATATEGVISGTDSCNSSDNVSTKTIKIVPNVISWRCINNKNAYTVSLNMKDKTDVYGWNKDEIDTHMMKNTEWGAVAYLSKSKYGANDKEVWNNSYVGYKTGCSGSNVNAANETTCIEYNTNNGVKASTTHNIYGIYDMSGGAWERTMSVYNNIVDQSGFTADELVAIDNKYINRYNTNSNDLLNGNGMNYDLNVYGDAVYETSIDARRFNGNAWIGGGDSWHTDGSYLPYVTSPWFDRGGNNGYTFNAGLFFFGSSSGNEYFSFSFRPVIFNKI